MHGVGFLDKTGSAAAAPRETLTNNDYAKQMGWFKSGEIAKKLGWSNFSPFYENATADYFFKCGYNNVPFVEAQQVLKDKIQQIMETDPLLTEVTDEYAKAAKQLDLK